MSPTRTLLLLYDELDADERRRADSHLSAHPQDWALVEEGRRLRELSAEVARAPLSDEVLAAVVAARVLEGGRLPAALQAAAAAIDRARAEDPGVARRYAELEDRLVELLGELPSPRSQLEQLLGHEQARARSEGRADRRDRRPVAPHQGTRGRYALVAVLLLAVVGLLFLLLSSQSPEHIHLAALAQMPAAYEPLRLRGADPGPGPAMEAYDQGLRAVAAAHRGIPPWRSFDEAALRAALRHFERATAAAPAGSAVAAEAYLARGRIHLHLGELERARGLFERAAAVDAPAGLSARELLEAMEASSGP